MKNKKGALIMYGLMAGLIGAIIVLMINSGSKTEFSVIGDSSLALLGTSKTAEEALFYTDQSAKYSLQQAVYDLAKSGGVSEIDETGTDEAFAFYECGRFNDAYVWFEIRKDAEGNYLEKECFDENQLGDHLSYLFDNILNKYLKNYPYDIPTSNYDYEVKDSIEIVGIANEPIRFDIYKNEKEIALKPKEFYVDNAGKIIAKKPEEKPGQAPSDASKSLVDFTGIETAQLGAEAIDIKGLCPKGKRCILAKEAFESLLMAQKTSKQKGVSLEVREAYRSLQRQKDYWEGRTKEKYKDKYLIESERDDFVCNPYPESTAEQRCTHLSGRAVDIRLQGRQMNSNDWKLLYQIMTTTKNKENRPAWVKYRPEPWHFECCDTERYARAIEQGVTELV